MHGAKAPPGSDGYPDAWYRPGHAATFHYPNRQDAATLWYHDHAMGIERLNQYAGLFGFFLVRDPGEDALGLPRGRYEVPLVVCDRLFLADGQLHYPSSKNDASPWVPEVYGDVALVNGRLFPYLEVEPRTYRLRVLNASNTRSYVFSLSSGRPFRQIGTDQGLLPAPVAMKSLTLAPAERVDVLVDFGDDPGASVTLQNQAEAVMQFRVGAGAPAKAALPPRLRAIARIPESSAVKTRTLTLNEYADPKTHRMTMLLDGKYWREPVTETPEIDTVEILEPREPHRGHPPDPPAPRALSGARPAEVRHRRVHVPGHDAHGGAAPAAGGARGRLERHHPRRARRRHAHHRALRGVRRPVRVALPPPRARGERDDAAARGGRAREGLTAARRVAYDARVATWLERAHRLRLIAQAGLEYSRDPYHCERFAQVQELAAEILAEAAGRPVEELLPALQAEKGYPTPKIDVRTAVFRDGQVLLVREVSDGKWALPGGWADLGESAATVAAREVKEESGYEVRITKLLGVLDKLRHGHPPTMWHSYTVVLRGELLGGAPATSHEIGAVDWFRRDALPALSLGRNTPEEVARLFEHLDDPSLPTDFD